MFFGALKAWGQQRYCPSGDQQSRRSSVVHPVSPLPPPSPAYLALMTSLDDLPSGYTAPLPVDETQGAQHMGHILCIYHL